MKSKSLNNLFVSVSNQHHVSPMVAKKVYESVFSLMRQVIKELPELHETSIEEMKQLRTNFFLPKFARFFIDIDKISKKRELKIRKYGK